MVRLASLPLLLIILSSAQAQLESDCYGSLAQNQDCNWYVDCLQAKYQCGPQGYPLGYGYVYCQRFGHLKSYPEVREWVEKTTSCLKQNLVPFLAANETMSCSQLITQAFKTHPICYEQGGFCQLFSELGLSKSISFLKELMSILRLQSFESEAAVTQVYEMGKDCLKQWF